MHEVDLGFVSEYTTMALVWYCWNIHMVPKQLIGFYPNCLHEVNQTSAHNINGINLGR